MHLLFTRFICPPPPAPCRSAETPSYRAGDNLCSGNNPFSRFLVTPPAQRVQFILGQEESGDAGHESHPVFSEMEELFVGEDGNMEWKETARSAVSHAGGGGGTRKKKQAVKHTHTRLPFTHTHTHLYVHIHYTYIHTHTHRESDTRVVAKNWDSFWVFRRSCQRFESRGIKKPTRSAH